MNWMEIRIKEIRVGPEGILYIMDVNGEEFLEFRQYLNSAEKHLQEVYAGA